MNNNIRQGKGKEGGEKERDGITAMLEGWVELEIIISPLIFVIYRVYRNHKNTSDSSVGTAPSPSVRYTVPQNLDN